MNRQRKSRAGLPSKRLRYCPNPSACFAPKKGPCTCQTVAGNKALYPAEYRAWSGMKNRCNNPTYHLWHRYGGRGITVCESWLNSFETFLADVGCKPSATALLDRIENSKGYEPNNVKWSEPIESSRNRDVVKPFTAFGMTKILPEWEQFIGRSRKVIWRRIQDGWPIDMAVAADPMPYEFRRTSSPIADYESWWRKTLTVEQVYVRRGLHRYKLHPEKRL